MTIKGCRQKQEILVVSALDLLSANRTIGKEPDVADREIVEELEKDSSHPAILNLQFPFELKPDQVKAVEAWLVGASRSARGPSRQKSSTVSLSGDRRNRFHRPMAPAEELTRRVIMSRREPTPAIVMAMVL